MSAASTLTSCLASSSSCWRHQRAHGAAGCQSAAAAARADSSHSTWRSWRRTVAVPQLLLRCCTCQCPRQHRLKLLVTSATLDGEKFSAYFNNCPVSSNQHGGSNGAAAAASGSSGRCISPWRVISACASLTAWLLPAACSLRPAACCRAAARCSTCRAAASPSTSSTARTTTCRTMRRRPSTPRCRFTCSSRQVGRGADCCWRPRCCRVSAAREREVTLWLLLLLLPACVTNR